MNLINSLTLILGGGGFAIDNVANKPFTQECTNLPTTPATSDTTVPTEPPQSKSVMGSNIFSKIDPMEGFRGIFLIVKMSIIKSLTSKAIPLATQFFKRAYKISHFPGL